VVLTQLISGVVGGLTSACSIAMLADCIPFDHTTGQPKV
jgi:hypothetical protein